MDDFKRCYSNEDESKSIPYFWKKFDPENYSIWLAEYKYNDELQKVFMSCNLITGTQVCFCCIADPFIMSLPFLDP
jgi:elongation factor 1-gamma